jgi:hypothetical protein|tara:strand:- start:95 stop:1174 length:1080 start_codon:yes stop_codon:yes gene_type:complete
MDPNEKIQLDDITFDDVIGDGVTMETIDEIEPIEDKVEEVKSEAPELDNIEEEEEDPTPAQGDPGDEQVETTEEDKEEVEGESTVVQEILTSLGYEGEYEDTADGLTELTKDVASQMADERIDEVLAKFPLVKEHLNYVLAGGESQKFMKAYDPNLDYNTMQLSEDDSRSQKAILSDYFTQKGHDREFIQEMLEDYQDAGKLHTKADLARKALGKVQAEEKEQLVVRQQQDLQKQQTQQQEFWNGVQETIKDSKEFAGMQVPEREKAKFFNYLSKPVNKDGLTQRDIDHSEAEMEKKLAIDYLMYKGFNLEGIINKKAKTTATKTLRQKISKNEETVKSARKQSRRSKSFDLDSLDLNI